MIEVRMENTDGLGREAQVWIGDELFTVCDSFSTAERKCPPGLIAGVRLAYVTYESFGWDEAAAGNRMRLMRLDHMQRWSYVGSGRVLSIMPVVIDFGVVTMEDANWTTDESLIGKYVRVRVDRLEITHVIEADWPKWK